MHSPSKREGAWPAPIPKLNLNSATNTAHVRSTQACEQLVDNSPLICSAQKWCEHDNTRIEQLENDAKEVCADCGHFPRFVSQSETRERETRALLCLILRRLSEIEAQLKSPLAARRLYLRYCAKCGERVTNANVGGYEGKSALTGRLYCDLCADEMEGLR